MIPTVTFYQTTLADYEQDYPTATLLQQESNHPKKAALTFCPPWKSTPIKLRQFLRGQGVPLHQRDQTLLLIAHQSIVAVQIQRDDLPNAGEWIVNRDYYYPSTAGDTRDSLGHEQYHPTETATKVPIRLFLPRSE